MNDHDEDGHKLLLAPAAVIMEDPVDSNDDAKATLEMGFPDDILGFCAKLPKGSPSAASSLGLGIMAVPPWDESETESARKSAQNETSGIKGKLHVPGTGAGDATSPKAASEDEDEPGASKTRHGVDDSSISANNEQATDEQPLPVMSHVAADKSRIEQLQLEKDHLQVQVQDANRYWQQEIDRLQEQHSMSLNEAKQWYQQELTQVRNSQEAELAAANQQATDAWMANRVAVADFTRQLQEMREEYETKLADALVTGQHQHDSDKSYVAEARRHLLEQHKTDMVNMANWMQEKYDRIETELIEALDQIDDMEEEIRDEREYWREKIDRMTHLQQEVIQKLENERDGALCRFDELKARLRTKETRTLFVPIDSPSLPTRPVEGINGDEVGYYIDPKTGKRITAKVQSPSGRSVENLRSPKSAFGVFHRLATSEKSTRLESGSMSNGQNSQVSADASFQSPSDVSTPTARQSKQKIPAPTEKENGSPNGVAMAVRGVKEKIEQSFANPTSGKPPLATPLRVGRTSMSVFQAPAQSTPSQLLASSQKVIQDCRVSISAPTTPSRLFQPTSSSAAKQIGTPGSSARLARPAAATSNRKIVTKSSVTNNASKLQAPRQSMLAQPKSARKLMKPTSRVPITGSRAGSGLTKPTGTMKKASVKHISTERKQKSLLINYCQKRNKSGIAGPTQKAKMTQERRASSNASSFSAKTLPPSIAKRLLQTPKTKVKTPQKTSPSEILRSILDCLTPENTSTSKAPRTPLNGTNSETIDETPRELPIDEKFESLFNTWTTAKKTKPVHHSPMYSANMPSTSLFSGWSTTKKAKREEPATSTAIHFNKRYKAAKNIQTPSRPAYGNTSQTPCETPLYVRGEIVDILSPEDLLVSPCLAPASIKQRSYNRFGKTGVSEDAHQNADKCRINAIKIQALFRGRIVLANFQNTKRQIVAIQSSWRMQLAMRQKQAKAMAIVKIQSIARMQLARDMFRCLIVQEKSLLLIKRTVRGMLARHECAALRVAKSLMDDLTRQDASLAIQRACRRFLGRRLLKSALLSKVHMLTTSSIAIQRICRGVLARRLYANARVAIDRALKENKTAIIIQRAYRDRISRLEIDENRRREEASVIIQRVVRIKQTRQKYGHNQALQRKKHDAASAIQFAFRETQARQACDRIQCYLMSLEEKRQFNASCAVQRIFRGMIVRQQVGTTMKRSSIFQAVVIIQCAARCAMARLITMTIRNAIIKEEQESRCCAATMIQRISRGFVARQHVSKLPAEREEEAQPQAAIKIQCIYRESVARREVQKLRTEFESAVKQAQFHAAIDLQRISRGMLARDLFTKRRGALVNKLAACEVQRTYRGMIARRITAEKRAARTEAIWLAQADAATDIQRLSRGMFARYEFAKLQAAMIEKQAAYHIQRACRGMIARKIVNAKRTARAEAIRLAQTKAATNIQRLSRGMFARYGFANLRAAMLENHASYKIQRVCRGMVARKIVNQKRTARAEAIRLVQTKAVTNIQSVSRGMSARLGFAKLKAGLAENFGVKEIQRISRGMIARKHYATVQASLVEAKKLTRAAITIQRVAKGRTARCEFAKLVVAKMAATKMARTLAVKTIQRITRQSIARAKVAKRRLIVAEKKRTSASIVIQKTRRMVMQRNKFQIYSKKTVIVQSLARRLLACKVVSELKRASQMSSAAKTIQRHQRGFAARLFLDHSLRCAISIQSYVRGFVERQMLTSLHASASIIQKCWRWQNERARFLVLKSFVLRLQALARCFLMRKHFQMTKQSAIIIQAALSRCLARRRTEYFLAMSAFAVRIQSLYRGHLILDRYQKTRQASIHIQSVIRGSIAKNLTLPRLLFTTKSATRVQANWRGHTKRRNYRRQRNACMKVQALLRGWKLRSSLKHDMLKASTVTLKQGKRGRKPLGDISSDRDSKPMMHQHMGNVKASENGHVDIHNSKRKPLGDACSQSKHTKLLNRGETADQQHSNGENRKNAQLFASPLIAKFASTDKADDTSADYEECMLEKLRVVDLRELLLANGVEKKQLRNVRKAELIEMAIARGCRAPV